MQKSEISTKNILKLIVTTGIYIALTLMFAPLSFSAVQIRFSEGLNHLVIFNKRYIYAITLGCFIVNIFSPFGLPDVFIGTIGSFLSCFTAYYLAQTTNNLQKKYLYSTLSQWIGVFIVSLELKIFFKMPFFLTFMTIGVGEMISMVVGIFLINTISKRIDLKS